MFFGERSEPDYLPLESKGEREAQRGIYINHARLKDSSKSSKDLRAEVAIARSTIPDL